MCGIAGFIAQSGRGRSYCAPAVLRSIEHRGPDDYGWLRYAGNAVELGRQWISPNREPEVLFLHRRLSILDATDFGWQPMATPDRRYHLIFNGEIYNYVEIREELQRLGYSFRSRSDTEVLLAAYAKWGYEAFRRFVGMFAVAILDTQRRTVLLARDFFGIKPLYYSMEDGFFCFGSEIKSLLSFGHLQLHGNPARLLCYLRYGMTDFGSETLLTNIQQLPAAHFLEISLDSVHAAEPKRYWSPESEDELDISFEEAAQKVRELFLRSVDLHLRSDVPLGSALSGGIDSSSIVMAIRHLDENADIHAFSYISDDRNTSEEPWMDIVVRQARAKVHKVRITPGELAADLDSMMHFHDEPFGSTSAYAQYQVFRAARASGVKVILDGQGADEILGGYRCYLGARLASLVRQGLWPEAMRFLHSISRLEGVGSYQGLAYCADYLLPPTLQWAARKLLGKDAMPSWLNDRWFAERGVGPRFMNYTTAHSVLKDSLARSLTETLPSLLRYEDRNSMASSVESRVPFLTPEFVSFLRRLPEQYLIAPDGTSKAVFRRAMRGIVPDAILDRRDKLGFVTPERRWLDQLDSWVSGILGSESAHQIPFLNLGVAKKEWQHVRDGKSRFDFRVWRWVNLVHWSERLGIAYN